MSIIQRLCMENVMQKSKQAIEKATQEYRKYQVQTLSPVEKEYLALIKSTEKTAKEQVKKSKVDTNEI